MKRWPLSLLLFFHGGVLVAALSVPLSFVPSKAWRPAEMWKLSVECSPPESGPKDGFLGGTPLRYTLYALVTGPDKQPGFTDGWRLSFVPGKEMPAKLAEERWYASIDRDSGWPRRYLVTRANKIITIDSAIRSFEDGAKLLTDAPVGVPVELFPPSTKELSAHSASGATFTLRKKVDGSAVTIVATLATDGKETLRIVQKWEEGEKWWTHYERYVNGHKQLSATLEKPPPQKIDPVLKHDFSPLRNDPKLHVRVTVKGLNPDFSDILKSLQEQTGLTFTVDPSLVGHKPQLGSLQLARVRVFAVLDFLAQTQMEKGRWEQTASGYQLCGISAVPASSVLVQRKNGVGSARAKVRFTTPWRWAFGGISFMLLIVAVAWRYHRRSVKPAA